MLVVVMVVLVVAMLAVDVVQMTGMDHGRVPAIGAVDVHVPCMRFVDLIRAIRAVLDQTALAMVQMPVVEEVAVIAVADHRVAAGLVVNVRVIGLAPRARCHDHIIGLSQSRVRPGRPMAVAA